jgi:hypothetical protein
MKSFIMTKERQVKIIRLESLCTSKNRSVQPYFFSLKKSQVFLQQKGVDKRIQVPDCTVIYIRCNARCLLINCNNFVGHSSLSYLFCGL